MKKLLKSLVIAGLVVVLAACSSGQKGGELTEADIAAADRVKEGKIEIYVPKGKNTDYLMNAMELYNKEFDTKLELVPVDVAPSDPMVQKITPMLVANEKMPDLIFLQDASAGGVFNKFENSFFSSEKLGFVEEHGSKFYSAKMNMLSNIAPSKKTFGFPNDWGNAVMFYNNAAFLDSNIKMEDVKTWDDLIAAGKVLKETTGRKLLFMRDTGELDLVKYLTEQQGVSMFDRDGNLNLTNDAVIEAYAIIKELIDADIVAFGPSADYTKIGQESGAIFAGGWLASYQAGDFPEDEGDWRIGKMPDVKPGEFIAPMSGGSSFYILKNSNNPTAAYQFISYALTNMGSLEGYMDLMGLPANKEAYNTPTAQKEFPYYGNQKILLTLDEVSQNSIEGYVFPYSADLNPYIEEASAQILKHGVDPLTALQKVADEFAQKYDIKVN